MCCPKHISGLGFFLLGALLLFTGCGRDPSPDEPGKQNGTKSKSADLAVKITPPKRILQGDPATYNIKIQNKSDHPLLLKDLTPVPRPPRVNGKALSPQKPREPAVQKWIHNPHGRLTYNQRADRFSFYESGKSASDTSDWRLYSGLLSPGKKTTVSLHVQHLRTGTYDQSFKLRFIKPRQRTLTDDIYVPEQPPFRIRDGSTTFIPANSPPQMGRVFCLKNLPDLEERSETRRKTKNVKVRPRPYRLQDAVGRLQELKEPPPDVTAAQWAPWYLSWFLYEGAAANQPGGTVWRVSKWEIDEVVGLPYKDVVKLNAGSGDLLFILSEDLPDQTVLTSVFPRQNNFTRDQITPGSSLSVNRQTALSTLRNVRRNGAVSMEWFRLPMSNQRAVKLKP